MQKAGASTKIYHEMLQRARFPLPYSEYTEDGVFIMDNDGLAVIFECSAYGGYNAEAGLVTALSALPEHAAMQFLMIPSRNLTNPIDKWKANKAFKDLYQVIKDDFSTFVDNQIDTWNSYNMSKALCRNLCRIIQDDFSIFVDSRVDEWKIITVYEDLYQVIKNESTFFVNNQVNNWNSHNISKELHQVIKDDFSLYIDDEQVDEWETWLAHINFENLYQVIRDNFTVFIDNQFDKWKSYRMSEELYRATRDDFANFVEDKATNLISNGMRCLATDYKLIISVIVGGRKKEYSILKSVFELFSGKVKKSDSDDDMEKSYKVILDVKNKMEAALKTANLFPVLMTPDMLIENVFCILNPNHEFRNIPNWEGNFQDMSDYMVANDTVFEIDSDYVSFDGMCGKSLSVKEYPKYWHCSMADQLVGAPFGSQSLESTVYLCLNVINVGKQGIDKTKRKAQVILSQNLNPHIFPRLNFKKIDLADASKQLELGEQLYHINLAIFPIANDYDSLQNVSSQVKSYYQGLGFKLEEDKFINHLILLSMLPGNYDERLATDLSRGRVVFQKNVVDLAPTSADWGGNTASPEMFFFTPRGQLFSFDFFAATNYNAFVIGTSGAGKSVLLQDIAMNYLMSGGRINIIDIGGSYANFCGIVGGQYIDIKQSDPISLNPFTELVTKDIFDEFKEFLVDWYWMMGSPESQNLSEEQSNFIKSYLSDAIETSYNKYGINSDVDTVLEFFSEIAVTERKDTLNDGTVVTVKERDIRCTDFIQILGRYGKKGDYGAFFNGKSEIHFNRNFVVLETGSMENSRALRDPILMILTYHISKSIYLSKDMSQRKLIIIDEAHKFLGNHRIDPFIEQAYRRFRKHGASMIIGTQGWEDLANEKSRAGRVIIENSAFQIIMTQSYASREKLKSSTSHQFNDYDKAMIDSISSVKGEFSEALLIADKNKVKIRIILSTFMKKTFFTSPKVRTYINQQVAKGVPLLEAVNSVPEELLKS